MKMQHYTVIGTGVFPTDMLRHDMSWPRDAISSDLVVNPPLTAQYAARLARFVNSNKETPNTKRWNSRGWRVVPDSIKTF